MGWARNVGEITNEYKSLDYSETRIASETKTQMEH